MSVYVEFQRHYQDGKICVNYFQHLHEAVNFKNFFLRDYPKGSVKIYVLFETTKPRE